MNRSVEEGTLTVLLLDFVRHHLPRVLGIRDRVEKGDALEEWDIEFLKGATQSARRLKPIIDHHGDYQPLYAGVVHLYQEIASRALENQYRLTQTGDLIRLAAELRI